MKKILLLLIFSTITTLVWSQPPPPPPPGPLSGTAAPIDTDMLYLILPAVLFAIYRLNKKRTSLVNDLK